MVEIRDLHLQSRPENDEHARSIEPCCGLCSGVSPPQAWHALPPLKMPWGLDCSVGRPDLGPPSAQVQKKSKVVKTLKNRTARVARSVLMDAQERCMLANILFCSEVLRATLIHSESHLASLRYFPWH